MPYGVKALRKLQFGRETTAGSTTAATTVWRGEGVIEDTRKVEFPVEDVGYVSGITRAYQPMLGAQIGLSATPATFEQLPHIFEMGVATTSGVRDTTGSTDYIYTYTMPTTAGTFLAATSSAIPTKAYSIQGGDNNSAEVVEFCHATDFELSFKAGEALMMSATIQGRQAIVQAFTAGQTAPTVAEILGSQAKFYIDAVGGTIGTTQITNEVIAASLKVKTGLKAVATADGNLYFSFIKGTKPEVTLDITFEHSTAAAAQKVIWRAGTAQLFQLKFVGPAGTAPAGATYPNKTLKINLAGNYEKFSALEEDDGDDTITATIRGGYNTTAAQFCSFVVANELSVLP